jgi:hypothetical protein
MTRDFDSNLLEQQFGECAGCNARRRFTRARALEYVTQIVRVVFEPTR